MLIPSFFSLSLSVSQFAAGQPAMPQPKQEPAQPPTQLEHLLNSVDNPSTWSKTPVSGITPNQTQYVPYLRNSSVSPSQYFSQPGNTLFSRQQLLRIFLGGTPQANPSHNAKSNWTSSTAYSDWQESENQASRAHDAEERARYEKDKGNREEDASEAYYAANAARDASDRVYQASLNGDATAKQYADRARAAADRARANSDRARYYADSYD
jgi:hypothetical protein